MEFYIYETNFTFGLSRCHCSRRRLKIAVVSFGWNWSEILKKVWDSEIRYAVISNVNENKSPIILIGSLMFSLAPIRIMESYDKCYIGIIWNCLDFGLKSLFGVWISWLVNFRTDWARNCCDGSNWTWMHSEIKMAMLHVQKLWVGKLLFLL